MNGILCIDKPQNMTSFDVCAILRRHFKVKVGHTGTLDPMATGVMIITLGSRTKLVPYLTASSKSYRATCKLGLKTSTGDIWGEVIDTMAIPKLTETNIVDKLNQFLGESSQIPPMVSAIKVQGKKLYEYARNHETVEIKPRTIQVHHIKLLSFCEDEIEFEVSVSAGTYIRTLCEDLGASLNSLGTLSSLRRTSSGKVTLDMCQTLETVIQENQPKWVNPLELIENMVFVNVEDPTFIYHGKRYESELEHDAICFTYQEEPLAIYRRENQTTFKSERGLW